MGSRRSKVKQVVVYQYDRAPTLIAKAISYVMKTGHKAAALDLLTFTTSRRCFGRQRQTLICCQVQYQIFSCCCQDELQEYVRCEKIAKNIERTRDEQRCSSLA